LLLGDNGDPSIINTDLVNFALVDLGDGAPVPNARLQRVASPTTLRAATAQEISAFDLADRTRRFTATSEQKDRLADRACDVRGRDVAAWNAMRAAQKVAAVRAEQNTWTNIREFIETNL